MSNRKLTAAMTKNINTINQRLPSNSRTLSDSASIQFMAKAIYPQLFKDFNPEKTYMDFYRQNLPVVPNGTFYLYPKGQ